MAGSHPRRAEGGGRITKYKKILKNAEPALCSLSLGHSVLEHTCSVPLSILFNLIEPSFDALIL